MRNAHRVSAAERVGTGRHLDAVVARLAAVPVEATDGTRRMTLNEALVMDQERRIRLTPVYQQTFHQRDAVNPRNVAKRIDLDSRDIPWRLHGSRYAYTNLRCRCEECRAANARHSREMRDRLPRSGRVGMPENTPEQTGRSAGDSTVASIRPRRRLLSSHKAQPSLFQEQGA